MSNRKKVWGPSFGCINELRSLIVPAHFPERSRSAVGSIFGMSVFVDASQPPDMLTIEHVDGRRYHMIIATDEDLSD